MTNFDWNDLASLFAPLLSGQDPASAPRTSPPTGDGSFQPAIDVFDTTEAYIIHASLPGAKKSDLDVSWKAQNNAISISGVIARPHEVDEGMLNTMTTDERQVGLFEREIRLGDGKSADVDVDGIGAKLEDGVLRVVVPKLLLDGWTEVRKVGIE